MSDDPFYGVMIEDTWVLGWSYHSGQLTFDLEASLWPGHPQYEPPRPNEWTCYKPATLVFIQPSSVTGLKDMHEVRTVSNADGTVDYGSLESIELTPPVYRVSGPFGDVTVETVAMESVIKARTD